MPTDPTRVDETAGKRAYTQGLTHTHAWAGSYSCRGGLILTHGRAHTHAGVDSYSCRVDSYSCRGGLMLMQGGLILV